MADNTKEAGLLSLIEYDERANNIVEELLSISTDSNDNNKQDPRAIAITGDWGMGKSHLIELIKKRLIEKTNNRIKIIDYDPWKMAGNRNNELGILREILREYGNLKDKIDRFLINSNSTLVEISGKGLPLAILIPLIASNVSYLLNSIQTIIMTGYITFTSQLRMQATLILLIVFLLLVVYIVKLLFIKPDFDTIKEYIREDTVIIVDNIDRCTPDEVFDVLRTIEIYNKVSHLIQKRLCLICVYNKKQIEESLKKVYSSDDQNDYLEKLFFYRNDLDSKKPEYFIEKFKYELKNNEIDSEYYKYLEETYKILSQSQEILGNYREINIKIKDLLRFTKKTSIEPVLFLLVFIINSPFSPSVTIFDNIIKNEGAEITESIEKELFNKIVSSFFAKDLNTLETKPGSTNHIYGRSDTLGEPPTKIHDLFKKIVDEHKEGIDFFKLKNGLSSYYTEKQLQKPLLKFFKKNLLG